MKRILLFAILLTFVLSSVFSQETNPLQESNQTTQDDAITFNVDKNWGLAIGEAIASDLILLGINRYVRNASYAYITWDSMYENLTNPWVWDQDEFSVNQIGHPYQGSVYFIAGRANNLTYWESYVPTVIGSVFWEIFMETEKPSINDFIVTTYGGAAVGEMLHRLFLESEKNSSWLSLALSPMGSLNVAITGKPSMQVNEKIESLTLGFSLGSLVSFREIENELEYQEVEDIPITLGANIGLVYGKAYGHETKTPYSHFELQSSIDWNRTYYSASLFSNGLLWSVAPPWNEKNADTTFGISQHYDMVISDDLWYNANSIGATIKQRVYLPRETLMHWSLHVNWLILGATEYYYFISEEIGKPSTGEERRDYDLSTGENIKFYISVGNKKLGTFSFWSILNGMHTIAGTVPENGSPGFSIISFTGFSYEHLLKDERYALGISTTLYQKTGFYTQANNVTNLNDYTSIYFKIRYK